MSSKYWYYCWGKEQLRARQSAQPIIPKQAPGAAFQPSWKGKGVLPVRGDSLLSATGLVQRKGLVKPWWPNWCTPQHQPCFFSYIQQNFKECENDKSELKQKATCILNGKRAIRKCVYLNGTVVFWEELQHPRSSLPAREWEMGEWEMCNPLTSSASFCSSCAWL